jgi:CyaY protein
MADTLTEQDFRLQADHALERVEHSLLPLADETGFELEHQNGVLQVVFEEPMPGKFVVSPNAPVRQVWVSAMARSFKLSWSPASSQFELEGETLDLLLHRLVEEFLAQ